jgi:hypothetical protein
VARKIVTAIEQRNHVFLVKRLVAGVAEVGRNARQVEVNSVTPGHGIDAIEISDPLVLDERGD